jgi:CRP-like cAMP-binding protein
MSASWPIIRPLKNCLLAQLPRSEWEVLEHDAEYVNLPAGTTLARSGERVCSVYFPTSGIVSVVSSFETGQYMELVPVGKEGLIGLGAVLKMQPSPYGYVVLFDSTGYRIHADAFERAFATLPALRSAVLGYLGRVLINVGRAAACNRFHSSHRRLARWLLVIRDKSGQQSLRITHEFLALILGGPRHAVTAALQELKALGAIECQRGRIEILDVARLRGEACECYEAAQQQLPN